MLDTALLTAALEAGVEARFGADVTELERDRSGRVTGVRFRVRGPRGGEHRAVPRSRSAPTGCAPASRGPPPPRPPGQGSAASACVYGYWPAAAASAYEWFYRPGGAAGIIPTNDGQVCVWVGLPAAAFAAERDAGLGGVVRRCPRPDGRRCAPSGRPPASAATGSAGCAGSPVEPAFLRRPHGPGWALVGDAGYFKDPLTAHGITDALRDAELLARAAVDGRPGAFARYEAERDALARPLVEVAERIAAYDWDLSDIGDLLRTESAAMRPEVAVVRSFDDDEATGTTRRAA